VTLSVIGDTTYGLANGASIIMALLARETLRTTSAWEVSTHPIALGEGWLTDTGSRLSAGERSMAFLAGKSAGVVDAAEGDRVGRVVTFLSTLLIFDLEGRTRLGCEGVKKGICSQCRRSNYGRRPDHTCRLPSSPLGGCQGSQEG